MYDGATEIEQGHWNIGKEKDFYVDVCMRVSKLLFFLIVCCAYIYMFLFIVRLN